MDGSRGGLPGDEGAGALVIITVNGALKRQKFQEVNIFRDPFISKGSIQFSIRYAKHGNIRSHGQIGYEYPVSWMKPELGRNLDRGLAFTDAGLFARAGLLVIAALFLVCVGGPAPFSVGARGGGTLDGLGHAFGG